jgi:uncharacterized protein YecT (DUF1311 family)
MKVQFSCVLVTFAALSLISIPVLAQTVGGTAQSPSPAPATAPGSEGDEICAAANTQMEINECFGAAYKKADTEMNGLYARILKKLTSDNQANLRNAQRDWLKYRDANCETAADLHKGGSIAPSIRLGCLERNTRARINELHVMFGSDK